MPTTCQGEAMPESIPATLIIDTLKDTLREARVALAAEVAEPPRCSHLGWILSVPDTHQKSVLAALDKEEQIRVLTCATEDEDRKSTRLNSSHGYISYSVFFFNDTATTEIYTLSLHDALPISGHPPEVRAGRARQGRADPSPHLRDGGRRSEEHTSELQSRLHLVFRLFF